MNFYTFFKRVAKGQIAAADKPLSSKKIIANLYSMFQSWTHKEPGYHGMPVDQQQTFHRFLTEGHEIKQVQEQLKYSIDAPGKIDMLTSYAKTHTAEETYKVFLGETPLKIDTKSGPADTYLTPLDNDGKELFDLFKRYLRHHYISEQRNETITLRRTAKNDKETLKSLSKSIASYESTHQDTVRAIEKELTEKQEALDILLEKAETELFKHDRFVGDYNKLAATEIEIEYQKIESEYHHKRDDLATELKTEEADAHAEVDYISEDQPNADPIKITKADLFKQLSVLDAKHKELSTEHKALVRQRGRIEENLETAKKDLALISAKIVEEKRKLVNSAIRLSQKEALKGSHPKGARPAGTHQDNMQKFALNGKLPFSSLSKTLHKQHDKILDEIRGLTTELGIYKSGLKNYRTNAQTYNKERLVAIKRIHAFNHKIDRHNQQLTKSVAQKNSSLHTMIDTIRALSLESAQKTMLAHDFSRVIEHHEETLKELDASIRDAYKDLSKSHAARSKGIEAHQTYLAQRAQYEELVSSYNETKELIPMFNAYLQDNYRPLAGTVRDIWVNKQNLELDQVSGPQRRSHLTIESMPRIKKIKELDALNLRELNPEQALGFSETSLQEPSASITRKFEHDNAKHEFPIIHKDLDHPAIPKLDFKHPAELPSSDGMAITPNPESPISIPEKALKAVFIPKSEVKNIWDYQDPNWPEAVLTKYAGESKIGHEEGTLFIADHKDREEIDTIQEIITSAIGLAEALGEKFRAPEYPVVELSHREPKKEVGLRAKHLEQLAKSSLHRKGTNLRRGNSGVPVAPKVVANSGAKRSPASIRTLRPIHRAPDRKSAERTRGHSKSPT